MTPHPPLTGTMSKSQPPSGLRIQLWTTTCLRSHAEDITTFQHWPRHQRPPTIVIAVCAVTLKKGSHICAGVADREGIEGLPCAVAGFTVDRETGPRLVVLRKKSIVDSRLDRKNRDKGHRRVDTWQSNSEIHGPVVCCPSFRLLWQGAIDNHLLRERRQKESHDDRHSTERAV